MSASFSPSLYKREPSFSFEQMFSAICLAHKYHIEDVEQQALESLQSYFAADFDDRTPSPVKVDKIHAIGAIRIARLTDTPSMLPFAFFQCSMLAGAVIKGWKREDGSVEYLDQDDLRRCMDGRAELARRRIKMLATIFGPTPQQDCSFAPDCQCYLEALLRSALEYKKAGDAYSLQSWKPFIHKKAVTLPICSVCKRY